VTWQCSDSVSEVVDAAVSEAVSTEGFNQSATGTCEDLAGNTASDTRDGINIDKTAPVVTGSVTTAIVVNGTTWYKDSADVAWSATDATPGSGVMAGSPTPTSATLLEGWSQSATATAYDNAGNVDTGSVVGINVDASPPTVTATIISTPAYNDWYKDSVDIAVSAADPPLSDLHAGVRPLDGPTRHRHALLDRLVLHDRHGQRRSLHVVELRDLQGRLPAPDRRLHHLPHG